jgi:hypothetical protein
MSDVVVEEIESRQSSSITRNIVRAIGDAFSLVRSEESNAALATVTLEELIGDQIKRNGESDSSNSNQFTPYSYDAAKESPAGEEAPRANFVGGSDTLRQTKLDRVRAIQGALSAAIREVKKNPPTDADYTESVEKGFGEEEVTRS